MSARKTALYRDGNREHVRTEKLPVVAETAHRRCGHCRVFCTGPDRFVHRATSPARGPGQRRPQEQPDWSLGGRARHHPGVSIRWNGDFAFEVQECGSNASRLDRVGKGTRGLRGHPEPDQSICLQSTSRVRRNRRNNAGSAGVDRSIKARKGRALAVQEDG